MKTIRIAQFIDTFYPTIDGVTRVVDNYAKILDSYENTSCCVFCPEVKKGYKDDFPYDVIRTKSLPLFPDYRVPMPKMSKGPELAFKERNINLVHSHSPFTLGHFGLDMAKRYNVPFVTTFHSKYYDDFLQRTHSKVISKSLVDYIVRLYDQADSVWTVGESSAETLREYGYKGEIVIMDNATTMIYPDDPETGKRMLAEKYTIPKEGKTLLFVGRITKQKNLYFMLDTMVYMKDTKLIVVGDGTELRSLKQYAEKKGIKDKVIFIGQVTDQVLLKSFFLISDLFFFPSTYDTSTLVAREAAALKVPTIMIRGCNSADLIIENQNGFLCDEDPQSAASSISHILSSPGVLQKVGLTASKTIGTSWEKRMPEVLEKYKEIIRNYHKA